MELIRICLNKIVVMVKKISTVDITKNKQLSQKASKVLPMLQKYYTQDYFF